MIDPTKPVERKAPPGKFRVIASLDLGECVPKEEHFVKDCDSPEEATSLVRSREERQRKERKFVQFAYFIFNDQGEQV